MSVSTQRLLMLIIALNIMVSIAVGFYQQPTTSSFSELDNYRDINEQYAVDIKGEESLASFAGQQEEGSFGSNVRMGKSIFGLFIRGLNPLPFNPLDFANPMERIFAYGLLFLRGALAVFIGLEIFLLIKNRKTG